MNSTREFEKRFLKLQKKMFRGERMKKMARLELVRLTSENWVTGLEAVVVTARAPCGACRRDYMVDELGESGWCVECADERLGAP